MSDHTKRPPMRRGVSTDAAGKAMDLPEGKTCADCVHCRRCCTIYGHIPEDEVCDWSPSRFRAAPVGVQKSTPSPEEPTP